MFRKSATLATALANVSLAFFIFPEYANRTALVADYGVTLACFNALNSTTNCDPVMMGQAQNPDSYGWTSEKVTQLCTTACQNDINDWVTKVATVCEGQAVPIGGMILSANYVPLVFQHGFNLVCLTSSDGSNCRLESYEWQGSYPASYPEDYCEFMEEYPPECDDPSFDPYLITDADRSVVELYSTDMICSDCFVKLWRLRLQNPFLDRDKPYATYLEAQYDDILSACTTTLPASIPQEILIKGTIAIPSSIPSPTQAVCKGQLVQPPSTLDCHALAAAYSIPLSEAISITGSIRTDVNCAITDTAVCLPQPCKLATLDSLNLHQDTCETIAATHNITVTQFLTWNPHLLNPCDQFTFLETVCVGPPGGAYNLPRPIFQPTATTDYHTTATPAVPTQPGAIADCGLYYTVVAGDTCQSISLQFGLTLAQFFLYNTEIFTSCTNLWLSYSVCVTPVTPMPTSTNGACGPDNSGVVCPSSGFGDCCSRDGLCGSGSDYCAFGNCISGLCWSQNISPDGTCGGASGGYTCPGSSSGDCCSTSGYCGSTSAYCGPGNCSAGYCDPNIGGKSPDGTCGPNYAGNYTCTGTQFGNCCSIYGYCGNGTSYCGSGNCYSGACR